LGLYGDRKGRKAAMVMVTSLMAVSIALITVAPTYHAAGILAPIFILMARLLQGFSAGGEFGTSTALLIEMAPDQRRGFYGSWQMAGQMLALLIGAAFGTLITEIFTPEQIEAWAWRLPFAFGLVIVPIAIYIRRNVDETAAFKRIQAEEAHAGRGPVQRLSLGQMLARHTRETLIGVGLVVTATVSIYITFTYLVTFSTKILNLPMSETFLVQMAGAAVMVVLTPFMGAWSDRVGRRPLV
ncbi:MFS transporter, partial [Bordetella hinzii]|nr:MFS transporter [Bordetella hinzii]